MVQLTGTGWGISVIEGGEIQKSRAVVIELIPGISDEQEVLRSIVDSLAEIVTEGTVRDELTAFAWFVAVEWHPGLSRTLVGP
jgi:hypothetical protein